MRSTDIRFLPLRAREPACSMMLRFFRRTITVPSGMAEKERSSVLQRTDDAGIGR